MYFKLLKNLSLGLFLILIIGCDKPSAPVNDSSEKKLKLYINEFMASNKSIIADERNQFDDWLEIYNGEDTAINLSRFYLTDNFKNPSKWNFPPITINPKGFLLIWCDEDSSQGILHTNFKLSVIGEEIGIFDQDLKPIDTITYYSQKTDTSFGRFPDGDIFWKFMQPTPLNKNK